MSMTAEEVLAEIGPVQEILDEHDGVLQASSMSGWYKTITKGSFPPCNPTGDDAELGGLG